MTTLDDNVEKLDTVEQISTEGDVSELEPKPKPKKKRAKRKAKSKKSGITDGLRNLDKDEETGAFMMPDHLYYPLMWSESKLKLAEAERKNAQITEREYFLQVQVELKNKLEKLRQRSIDREKAEDEARQTYLSEVARVETETGLKLKEWVIDDHRALTPLNDLKGEENG